jgi:hypothetical protein
MPNEHFCFYLYYGVSYPYVGLLNKAFMAAYIYTIAVQAEIISLILYHNSTFIITNLSKHDEISFVVGEFHLRKVLFNLLLKQ